MSIVAAGIVSIFFPIRTAIRDVKCSNQRRDVLTARPQRRHRDGVDVKTVEEVRTELAAHHRLVQPAVGGRDDAHIDLARLSSADPLELAFLQYPQEFGLEFQGNLAHLVQENGTPVGQFESSLALLGRAGEGPFFVAEKLAFHQRRLQRGTVELDEAALGARTVPVHVTGDELLAGAGLPLDEDRAVGGRHLGGAAKNVVKRVARAYDLGGIVQRADLLPEVFRLLLEPADPALGLDAVVDIAQDQRQKAVPAHLETRYGHLGRKRSAARADRLQPASHPEGALVRREAVQTRDQMAQLVAAG